jgi:secreted trypsin-like serine protease
VTGWGVNKVADLVCTSGAFSRERCNIQIIVVNENVNLGGTTVTNLARGEQTGKQNAAGQGDSGGPVYVSNTNGTATARGMVTGGDLTNTSTPCTGVTSSRSCSWRIWFSQLSYAVNYYKATVNS